MAKPPKLKRPQPAARPAAAPPSPSFSPPAQETRALLRRIPDGLKAALNSLAARPQAEREQVLTELIRGLGKDALPLVRAAALGAHAELAASALRVLPAFGTRAAGDVLVEAYQANPQSENARLAWQGSLALQARGINIRVPAPPGADEPEYRVREMLVCAPDSFGARSPAARLQDEHGVWHVILLLWNDTVGVKDGFMRASSRQEWAERMERKNEGGKLWTACPPDFGRWQVARAKEISAAAGLNIEEFIRDWDRWVGPPPEGYQPPDPTGPVRAAPAAEREQWLADSKLIFEALDARTWFLEAADCVPWGKQWTELQDRLRFRGSSEGIQAERNALLEEVLAALVPADHALRYRERLVDLARVAEWRDSTPGGQLTSRRACAAAVAQEEGRPLLEIPFFAALAERSLFVVEYFIRRGEDPVRAAGRPGRPYLR